MVFLSAGKKMKTAVVPTLKHLQTNGCMSIWLRKCFSLSVVGMEF